MKKLQTVAYMALMIWAWCEEEDVDVPATIFHHLTNVSIKCSNWLWRLSYWSYRQYKKSVDA